MARTEINAEALSLLKTLEGFKARPYPDPGGIWTIGYGTTRGITKDTPPVTMKEAEALMMYDLKYIIRNLNAFIRVPVNDNQFGALCLLAYNIGLGAFQTSTLLKLLNNSNYEAASGQFERWNKIKINGVYVESPGLTNRRRKERALFLKVENGQ